MNYEQEANCRTIFRKAKNKENPYLMMHKQSLQDRGLSWKAKGILAYLLSLPDNWKLYQSELVTHSKDGKESLKNGMNELMDKGYLRRSWLRSEHGKYKAILYEVFEVPEPSESGGESQFDPKAENPLSANLDSENPPLLNNNITYTERKERIHTCVSKPPSVKPKKVDVKVLVDCWNHMASKTGLKKAQTLTPLREQRLRSRFKDLGYDLDAFKAALVKVTQSSFLLGGGGQGWKLTIDDFVNPTKFPRIIEGCYDDNAKTSGWEKFFSDETQDSNDPEGGIHVF